VAAPACCPSSRRRRPTRSTAWSSIRTWCKEARKFLAVNENGHKVEVIHADAFEYLPPEPVDVVICEMIHVGMLREKQVEMMESFKRRYLARFGGPLPVFLPEAVIMAVQPLQQEYDFEGFHAPIIQFQPTNVIYPGTVELAQPGVYSIMDFSQPTDMNVAWEGRSWSRRPAA
jgi:protein arginine N-methyltransferase 1